MRWASSSAIYLLGFRTCSNLSFAFASLAMTLSAVIGLSLGKRSTFLSNFNDSRSFVFLRCLAIEILACARILVVSFA